MQERQRIIVGGIVQGVGFRPFTARLARRFGLTGFVRNDGDRVLIETSGSRAASAAFAAELRRSAPGIIDRYHAEPLGVEFTGERGFRIESSAESPHFHGHIPTDRAPCTDCLNEFRDPTNRRFLYPLITCSECGPRFTIMSRFPWDRRHTSMGSYTMCRDCLSEYNDPSDRRLHAQTISCWRCGPRIAWCTQNQAGNPAADISGLDAMSAAAKLLTDGAVIAVKGAGGYQFICRADSTAGITRLRLWKQRPHKPLALMTADTAQSAPFALVDHAAARMLQTTARPIVLLRQHQHCNGPEHWLTDIAAGNPYIGVMLPPTAIHQYLADRVAAPLVVTSANRSGKPICTSDTDIRSWFSDVADGLLWHDRTILNRADDPVVHITAGEPTWLRHGRGSAPVVTALPHGNLLPDGCLAAGADLKNAGAVANADYVLLSQHNGNMHDFEALGVLQESVSKLAAFAGIKPQTVVSDLHPEYRSRLWADDVSREEHLTGEHIQHHIAHVASCMLEHGLEDGVTAFAWDGTGYGSDGTVWGGETFTVDHGFFRTASLRPFKLLGGDRAVREPWRVLVAILLQVMERDAAVAAVTASMPSAATQIRITADALTTNIPVACTSMGRLFDSAAALVGATPPQQSFDGQAPLALEHLAWQAETTQQFSFEISESEGLLCYDWRPTFREMADCVRDGESAPVIARRFHNTLAAVATALAKQLGCSNIILTGGVFQNRLLTETMIKSFKSEGFRVYRNCRIPGNDAGIAAGQISAAALRRSWNQRKEAHVPVNPC